MIKQVKTSYKDETRKLGMKVKMKEKLLSKSKFSSYIKSFDFENLFNHMGWNHDSVSQKLTIESKEYLLKSVAEKEAFKILVCESDEIPTLRLRKHIESEVTKFFQEHLIIFIDHGHTKQIWQLVTRQIHKPNLVSEVEWNKNQEPEALYQKTVNLFFTMKEEDQITIVDVKQKVTTHFQKNSDQVTKKFFDQFKKEHNHFKSKISGINIDSEVDWYASLMLNRLMFCYFIQKKGFLFNYNEAKPNFNYLSDRLDECISRKAQAKGNLDQVNDVNFYSFYKNFLLVLFHSGLNHKNHDVQLCLKIGKVPYLNGGLFEQHLLEKKYTIDIEDIAFIDLFKFFDQYQWHLDTSVDSNGKEINPDVIGYIFEKYINDRSGMGAYYTKEDISNYISKNCIIPYLFEETQRNIPSAFDAQSEIWELLRKSGDDYIYDSIKKGVYLPLPMAISNGKSNISLRAEWQKEADASYGLPTEIWREVVERRDRYEHLRDLIMNGKIQCISDFILYNLDIQQFIQDIIETTTNPQLIKSLYEALCKVTIIDPTCGSGAFLFAALHILEPLYDACLNRMHHFLYDQLDAQLVIDQSVISFFKDELTKVKNDSHPNRKYFIYKSIILQNLYGVDLMKEAVEIAKLRLFLKLMSTVDAHYSKPNLGIEPLPDIDFNIKAGNTLIGFTSEQELIDFFTDHQLDAEIYRHKDKVLQQCQEIAVMFEQYQDIQLHQENYGEYYNQLIILKTNLRRMLDELNQQLNRLLLVKNGGNDLEEFIKSHQPLHWIAEFYRILNRGGFDVVIGNPPYVEYSEKNFIEKYKYKLREEDYKTIKSRNLYAFVVERSLSIIHKTKSYIGMIIPLSSISGKTFGSLREIITKNSISFFSSYEIRPQKLFHGVDQRLTIFIRKPFVSVEKNDLNIYSTNILRWSSEQRQHLFKTIGYVKSLMYDEKILRFSSNIENQIIKRFINNFKIGDYVFNTKNQSSISFRNAGARYWLLFFNQEIQTKTSTNSLMFFKPECSSFEISAVLNSSLFWWWYAIQEDMFHIVPNIIQSFRYNLTNHSILKELSQILEDDLNKNKRELSVKKNNITIQTFEYQKKKSKHIIDEIDKILAQHYGFTDEELDFIINYDIKYRMSKEEDSEE